MSQILIIRPRAGKFLKDSDFFSKMDPFIRVTIGTESQRTETALNQGKTPAWKTVLNFRVSAQQLNMPDSVNILFEAFDEDSATSAEFLGRSTLKLSQARSRPGEISTVQLVDGKNKPVGTVDVEFEFRQDTNPVNDRPSSNPQQVRTVSKGHNIGTLVVRPTGGKFDVGITDAHVIYLVFIHGDTAFQSNLSEGPGRRPVFRDTISFQQFEGEDMLVRCFDSDPNKSEMIGEGLIQVNALSKKASLHKVAVPIALATKKVAELNVEVEFFPDVLNNPVKVYAPILVKKGEYVTKKIKYSNPDRFKKNLSIRSENSSLIQIKTETVSILPNEYGEIRFKVSPPQNPKVPEERCRVDIVVEDTNVVEESLMFKIRLA